jgi:hypothetical protein
VSGDSVLNNNALSITADSSLKQDATTKFPLEIFNMKSLKEL